MNMWADTLPNNSFTSCKLLIDVQKHRYHPYRFRFTNRIIYRVKSTFRKKYLFTRSLCGITKILFGSPKQTEPTGIKAFRAPREADAKRQTKKRVPGAEARREPRANKKKRTPGNPAMGLDRRILRR